ncbi:hypothetical protein Ddye_015808 [Dipteronia dyeriana]|uniref:Reverse transcriptase domain-containing protein n=1 Tax=Dipteronia dyeriana TaxID=168575 RepID=A0AAD9U6K9_9ROSI|nr:hypothetical protein Ddye_015808 [Dipteronia dyeriana]
MKDYIPISLVGSLYKILAKVLANRIIRVLDSVVGESQMVFIKNRQILDSFIIADEIIHHWKKSYEEGLLLKLDFKKAYDSVDHVFIDDILSEMGFGERWRFWMKCCIITLMFSVLVNGSPTRQFKIKKGLKQGDPLSPFLFNMEVEGLNALFKKAETKGLMKGVTLGMEAVHVSYLQFSDDTILFLQLKIEYLLNVRRMLRCFELASRLRINFQKTCLVKVGKRRNGEEDWASIFRCSKASCPISYLGLPLGGWPFSKIFWSKLIRRIENRLAL